MIYRYFPVRVRETIKQGLKNSSGIEEIRVRCGQNIVFCDFGDKWFLDNSGAFTKDVSKGIRFDKNDLKEMLKYFTQNSVYAMQQDIKNGFITLPNGARVGLCGRCIVKNGVVENISSISSFNIRLPRQVDGWGNNFFKSADICSKNVLIIAPPGYGKTTLLRNMIKYVSDLGKNVSVIDEKCEISPLSEGNRVFDLGLNTDVLSDISKKEGINIMLKTMNPEIIATDEIQTKEDFKILKDTSLSGVNVFATFHGTSKDDFTLKAKSFGVEQIPFEYFVVISKDKTGRIICCQGQEVK